MGTEMNTSLTEFILVGFSDLPHLQVPLFVISLLIYLVTITGNLLVMAVIYWDSHLHTPMYFFLSNLSFVDICYTSIIFPKLLVSFFLPRTHLTLLECLLQLYFFFAMIGVEFFLLTMMAYDRYVAICHPLHYTVIMSKSTCFRLATAAWMCGLMQPIVHTAIISTFSFCDSHEINHFFCDFPVLLRLSCTNTRTVDRMTFILGLIASMLSCLLILASYVKIISTILKIRSSAGRHKAFSTCASHLTVVILYYGILIFVYIRPASMYSEGQSKILSFIYCGVIPMCNPMIYTLKNKEFTNALHRQRGKQY